MWRHPLKPVVLAVLLAGALLYLGAAAFIASGVPGTDRGQPAGAVLVLGARAMQGGRLNPCLAARVRQGVALVQAGRAPLLLVSGGPDAEDGVVEADAMSALALRLGLLPNQVRRERQSRSTADNMRLSAPILRALGAKSVIIVSEPFHLARAGLLARAQGLPPLTLSPVPDSSCWTRWRYLSRGFLREPLALVVNKLAGDW